MHRNLGVIKSGHEREELTRRTKRTQRDQRKEGGIFPGMTNYGDLECGRVRVRGEEPVGEGFFGLVKDSARF